MFDATRIRNSTGVQQVEIHQQLDSTNDRAIQLIRENSITTPALIVAQHQTAGRGQRDRKWWSGTGSLTFSWIPPLIGAAEKNEGNTRLLPIAAALAIAEAIESQTELSGIEIKWPNDLVVSGKKLCGILTESVSVSSRTGIVVGIGINVNNKDLNSQQVDSLSVPRSISLEPTSVLMETRRPTPMEDLLIAVVERLEREFELTKAIPDSIVDRCNERLAYLDRTIEVETTAGESVRGKCQRIANDGGLIVKTSTGVVRVYRGTISVA